MRSVAPRSPAALAIGELSRRTGVNIETIRYYERIKMLPAPPRTASGRRVYGPAETRTFTFIRRARELGFTLDEVRALLALSEDDGRAACVEVRQLAADHLTKVKAKIADLRAMGRVLGDAVRRCDAGELPVCPLIDSLSAASPLINSSTTIGARPHRTRSLPQVRTATHLGEIRKPTPMHKPPRRRG
jgi:MerR family mercuric resistance operon transcriptional regulator